MQYNIELRALAVIEILEAFDWYELQQAGLGSDFLNEPDVFYNNPCRFFGQNPKWKLLPVSVVPITSQT